MSRQLNRLRSIVSEIEQIQRQGQKLAHSSAEAAPVERMADRNSSVKYEPAPASAGPASTPAFATPVRIEGIPPEIHTKELEIKNTEIRQLEEQLENMTQAHMATQAVHHEVSMVLSGDVNVKFQVKETQEIIEVRRKGDMLEIGFTDGKSVHLPLKSKRS